MGSSSVVVGLLPSQDRLQVAVTEDQHPVGDLRPGGEHESFCVGVRGGLRGGIITALTPALTGPSQASNHLNVLVAGLHGRCPCLSAVHLLGPGERTDE
jgi:hypothetical protein